MPRAAARASFAGIRALILSRSSESTHALFGAPENSAPLLTASYAPVDREQPIETPPQSR